MTRLAPAGYPGDLVKTFFARDGRKLLARPILPDDALLLRRLFTRLSPESVFQRFHGRPRELSEEASDRLACVDYRASLALVAIEPAGGEIVAVARYHWSGGADLAEAAVVVDDAWQGRGVGMFLMAELVAAARRSSIMGFEAYVLSGNRRMLRMLADSGYVLHIDERGGVVHLRLRFDDRRFVAWDVILGD